jgi:uncharacterized membrane protein
MEGDNGMQLTEGHRQYWRKNLRITAILLAIWFVVTFVVGFFARDLNFTFSAGPSASGWAPRAPDRLLW